MRKAGVLGVAVHLLVASSEPIVFQTSSNQWSYKEWYLFQLTWRSAGKLLPHNYKSPAIMKPVILSSLIYTAICTYIIGKLATYLRIYWQRLICMLIGDWEYSLLSRIVVSCLWTGPTLHNRLTIAWDQHGVTSTWDMQCICIWMLCAASECYMLCLNVICSVCMLYAMCLYVICNVSDECYIIHMLCLNVIICCVYMSRAMCLNVCYMQCVWMLYAVSVWYMLGLYVICNVSECYMFCLFCYER